MDITNLKSCISHDEATIRSFMRDPEFAEYYLNAVLEDGDADEIAQVQAWYDEAKARMNAEAPATPEGYAFLKELFLASRVAAPATMN